MISQPFGYRRRVLCGCVFPSPSITSVLALQDDLVKVRSGPQALAKEIEAMKKEMM